MTDAGGATYIVTADAAGAVTTLTFESAGTWITVALAMGVGAEADAAGTHVAFGLTVWPAAKALSDTAHDINTNNRFMGFPL